MKVPGSFLALCALLLILQIASSPAAVAQTVASPAGPSADHQRALSDWFLHGRVIPGSSAAELRRSAYLEKMKARAERAIHSKPLAPGSSSSGGWTPLGPVPLASDATGDGFQNYNQVSGRATAIAIDPADPSGNTVFIGGAQGGVWKSSNAANAAANDVTWSALTDDQATLSTGAIAIQPGNTNLANSLIVVGTGEADNSTDSYFGLGILVSSNAGLTWNLVTTANSNNGTLSFAGLGATRIAFSTAATATLVAAMASTNEGVVEGEITSSTYPGLYTSTDSGATWTYDALSPGSAPEATSATSVVYNSAAGLFFAAIRYQGFFSSPDGLAWTRLANQPGAPGLLSASACPQIFVTTCPIYRGEISVVGPAPGMPPRNEMYAWFVSADANGNPVDQGIWQTLDGGATPWIQINDSGITNVAICGDFTGCGVAQGFYNLELLALPNGPTATDLYAGAINLYKCSITVVNPWCNTVPFANLTHAYGCDPLAAPAHVHPDQHALAFMIPTAGPESGSDLMFFANDGGIYRALNGYTGLTSGQCSGTNQFDDLNQNLGSMTQFVGFSESASDANTILGGTQGNGSPASRTATTSSSWGNVLSGDGGFDAIDSNTGNWFASNPDTPAGSGALNILECPGGTNCNNSVFNQNVVVSSSPTLSGDDGAFYFPYLLDPQSYSTLLVGTCRVWSGPRSGGSFTLLSPNFDTLGTGTCSGSEVNTVRSLAAGGPHSNGFSQVIYATTDGPGPNESQFPVGGNVWVTTNATAFSGGFTTFANVTLNGPNAASINPNQFPISGVAIDTSDPSGSTAYVTIMGFATIPGTQIPTGHVWQTTSAGASWIDFTGSSPNNLPDSPANSVVVDSATEIVYVGTDVGVFQSPTSAPSWAEVGPVPMTAGACGFLPDVAVTGLSIFDFGGQKFLRASTYGRGIWQISLPATNSSSAFCLSQSGPFPTINVGSTTAQGSIALTASSGFTGTVQLSCSVISVNGTCSVSPASVHVFPATATVTLTAGNLTAGSYQLVVQGTSGQLINSLSIPFNVADFQLSGPQSLDVPSGGAGSANLAITPSSFYFGSINANCSIADLPGASCTLSQQTPIIVAAGSAAQLSANIGIAAGTPVGAHSMTLNAEDTSGNPIHNLIIPLQVTQNVANQFTLSTTQAFGVAITPNSAVTAKVAITSNYAATVSVTCDAATFSGQCSVAPLNPVPIANGTTTLAITVNVPNSAAPSLSNSYKVNVTVTDSSGQPSQNISLPLTVIQDFDIGSVTPATQTITVGQSATYNFSVLPVFVSFANAITFSCSAPAPCTFRLPSVAPGSSSVANTMTIATIASSSANYDLRRNGKSIFYIALFLLPAIAYLRSRRAHPAIPRAAAALGFLSLFLALLLISCGGGGTNGGGSDPGGTNPQQLGTTPGTYTITVTGTSGIAGTPGYLSHKSSPVTLVVNAQ